MKTLFLVSVLAGLVCSIAALVAVGVQHWRAGTTAIVVGAAVAFVAIVAVVTGVM